MADEAVQMPELRNEYSFAPGDPPVVLPRPLAVSLLNSLEMWQDVVTRRVGRPDERLAKDITELTGLLLPEDKWRRGTKPDTCPKCGQPKLHNKRYNEWACSDPDCVMAHGSGPGGGHTNGTP